METGELVSYGLSALGIAAIGWAVWSTFRIRIDREMGNAVLLKLLKANNHYRARKLCSVSPGSYFDAVKVAIEACTASGSKDLVVLEGLAMPAFDAKGVALTQQWRGVIERGAVGVMLMFGGAALALSSADGKSTQAIVHLVGIGLALLAAAYFAIRRRYMEVTLDVARREIVPAVIKSVIDSVEEPAKKPDDTGPFRTIGTPKLKPTRISSLREGVCPLCGPTSTRTIDRGDPRFSVLVCRACGFTQEFADLAKLDPSA